MHSFLIGMREWSKVELHRLLYVCQSSCGFPPCDRGTNWRRCVSLLHVSVASFGDVKHWRRARVGARSTASPCPLAGPRRTTCCGLRWAHRSAKSQATDNATEKQSFNIIKFMRHGFSHALSAKYPPPSTPRRGVVLVQPQTQSRFKFCPPGGLYRTLSITEKNYGRTTETQGCA